MIKKQYFPPEMETWFLNLEAPVCLSTKDSNEINDYTLINPSDIDWL